MQRVILHCDANSFFASVELLGRPELKELPVAVCGNPENRHGIILAKNEAAKKFKVQTAETIWQAKKKCPELILLPPHHNLYSAYSKKINEIYSRYSDRVEAFGIDESWLDITGTWHLFGKSPLEVAHRLRMEVKAETGLTISIGLSFNKVFAKLGSDYKKPDAVTEFSTDNYKQLVWALPVSALLYVGKRSAQTLAALGIKNIGQLAGASPDNLTSVLGKQGEELWHYARGEDTSEVRFFGDVPQVKSVGNGFTFKRNLTNAQDIRTGVRLLSDEVASRLRRHGLFCTCVSVQIKDTQLKSIQRQKQLLYPSHLASDISKAAAELVLDNWEKGQPIRMITITGANLTTGEDGMQTCVFAEGQPNKKKEMLEQSLDKIRGKYGHGAISTAHIIKNELGFDDLKIEDYD